MPKVTMCCQNAGSLDVAGTLFTMLVWGAQVTLPVVHGDVGQRHCKQNPLQGFAAV